MFNLIYQEVGSFLYHPDQGFVIIVTKDSFEN